MEHESLDDQLDALVAEYSDLLGRGESPRRADYLARVPGPARPGLERVLKMIEAGLAQAPSAQRPLAPGLRLGHYELVREIGRGGMALVWLAQDTQLRRPVALKVLRPGLALEQRHADRFQREGQAIAKLAHPHIVQIFGVGADAGYHYLAMEFVEGPSLATVLEALAETPQPWTAEDLARTTGIPSLAEENRGYEQALAHLLAPVAEALAVAHDAGLVHRDVKPSNILLHRDGRAVVADFGLAKGEGDPALSLTGDTLGTPYYMSPEQAYVTGHEVDHRTDVYSLGVTLYEALSGARPFGGDSFLEVIESIRTNATPSLPPIKGERSRDATAVVRRAMQRNPEERYPSARALHADLCNLAGYRATVARQAEGSPLRRVWSEVRLASSGMPYEYKSPREFLGLPLVHVISGPRLPGQGRRVAKGWFASGDVAIGGLIATGPAAVGTIAIGGFAAGGFSWGGIAAGLLCFGGITFGGVVMAGIGVAYLAFAGVAIGYGAVGGMAYGKYTMGGKPNGTYRIGEGYRDEEAVEFFQAHLPWFAENWMP